MFHLIDTYSYASFNRKAKRLYDDINILQWSDISISEKKSFKFDQKTIGKVAKIDRSVYHYGKRVEDLSGRYLASRQAFEEQIKPGDIVIGEAVNSAVKLAAFDAAESVGAHYLACNTNRVEPNRLWWTDDIVSDLPKFKLSANPKIVETEDSVLNREEYLIQSQNSLMPKLSLTEALKNTAFMEEPVFLFYMQRIQNHLRRRKTLNYKFDGINSITDPIVLFPLQYFPEVSTSTWANDWTEEKIFGALEKISSKTGFPVYLKEHPHNLGYRKASEYKKFQARGFKVLSPKKISIETIPKGSEVVTLNSTFGYEALKAGFHVTVLGNCFYSKFARDLSTLELATNERVRRIEKFEDFLSNHSSVGCFDPALPQMINEQNIENVINAARDIKCEYFT